MTKINVSDADLATFTRRTSELYRRLTEGTLSSQVVLGGLQALIEGRAEPAPVARTTIVDLDAAPFTPDGWTVVEHKKGGTLDLATAKIGLYLAKAQKNGSIGGEALRADLADEPVLNANVLDFLLANPHLIPEEWKGKCVFFWGTVYRDGDGRLCVRYLSWRGGGWGWYYFWLDDVWHSDYPAAVSQAVSA